MNLGCSGLIPMHPPGFPQSLPGDCPRTIQEWQPSVEAEVGVDQFGLLALEFELMFPSTVTVPKCVTVRAHGSVEAVAVGGGQSGFPKAVSNTEVML